ncbi:globin family protein [Roseateles sp.]|uniref:globin family protein n=1 Tax=Roseateles sp. TaxID=1971397 RepID=UPI0039E8763C
MTPQQIAQVRGSFAAVEPICPQIGALFYDKLFERDPTVAALFRSDMSTQARRLMEMIAQAVQLLDSPEQLDTVLGELGQRHLGYGVRAAHYPVVGGALLDTLAASFGGAFTPELRSAWVALYEHVSCAMLAGATRSNIGSP